MQKLSNETLLAQYQNAELPAFEEFFRRNRKLVYNFLRLRLGNAVEADDALQETFFRIHKHILKYDPAQKALGWVFSIARNVANDAYRKRKSRMETSEADVDRFFSPEISNDAKDVLNGLMNDLTQEERELLVSRFYEEDSFEEIAEKLDVKEAGARQRVSRLIRKIRRQHSES